MDLEAIKAVIAQSLVSGVDDESVMLAGLLAQRRARGAPWIAPHVLGEILTDLDVNALGRRRPVIEAVIAEALRSGSPDVAVSMVDRLWAAMQTVYSWERIHSETVMALGALIWEVRPSAS